MVLPAPVGPTIATVWPGWTVSDRSSISGMSAAYRKLTSRNSTRPRTSRRRLRLRPGPGSCSSASSRANTRSAEATPDCSRLAMLATWVSGWLNWREYWMNACTSPSDSAPTPPAAPPTTATRT